MTLGITGRSGCGKSTVTAVFAARGIPLADADRLSREILLPGSPLLPQLAERFGYIVLILKLIGVNLVLVLLTVIEHKSRNFTWRNKIIRIFAANIYNI